MEKAKALIEKYKAGTCNDAEKQLIDRWLLEIHASESSDLTTEDFEQIQAGVWAYVEENKQSRKISKLWPRIAAAAAVLLVVGLSIFFFNRFASALRHPDAGQDLGLASNNIKTGSNKAYLTLASGKRLSLTDAANGAIAKEGGVEITKTADGQVIYNATSDNTPRHPELDSGPRTNYSNALNTIETPRGGQYQIRLPDGSKVWLNAASKLIYPVTFTGRGQREVTLSGEAYFEIAKDKQHPFHVKSAGQVVEVLGTHFNISTYADEPNVKTTLLEGLVKVNEAILKPGEQATLENNKIKITAVNTDYAVAWKDGRFVFNSENLESIMNEIARWYNVNVEYEDPSLKKETFFGTISKYENVAKVLNMLERTDVARFAIDGHTIKVSKKK